MDPNAKEIRPAIELDNLLVWDEASLPEYPSGENILVENNSEVFLNFYYTNFHAMPPLFSQGGTVTNKITKIIVDWGDGQSNEYNYQIDTSNINWLRDISTWLVEIGPHRYSFPTGEEGEKSIIIKFYDSANYFYGLKINLDILSKSFYNLKFELDVQKAVFNSEQSSVIFKINKSQAPGEIPNDLDAQIPIVSILN